MKTIIQALIDEVIFPIPYGKVENICIKRGLSTDTEFSTAISASTEYKGALADCLRSLIQAVNFSESDKSVGTLTDDQRTLIINMANKIYEEIGEELIDDDEPMVYIGG